MTFNATVALRQAANDFFPFTLRAQETLNYTYSPHAFREAFLSAKPEGMSWYAYDVIVRSPTKITFVVYDMRDMTYGGIGGEIGRVDWIVDPKITGQAMNDRMFALARDVRQQELEAAEMKVVAGYADQIRDLTQEPVTGD